MNGAVNRPLRLGIIGAGRVGQVAHLQHYAALPGIELALADMRPALLTQVADRFAVRRRFADHRALLAAGVDAVVVVVRRPATGPVVLDALAAGVPVLSEKPMALTHDGGRRLVETARRLGVRYGVGYMKRHDAGVQTLKAQVALRLADGALGELTGVRAWSRGGADGSLPDDFSMTPEARPDGLAQWPAGPDWLAQPFRAAYEETLNVHSHITNLVRWIVGDVSIAGVTRSADGQTRIDTLTATKLPVTFELRDGEHAGPWREGLRLTFTGGALRLDLAAPFAVATAGVVTECTAAGERRLPVDARGGAFARQARAFVRWVRGAGDFASPGADALVDLAFADDLWWRLGTPALTGRL